MWKLIRKFAKHIKSNNEKYILIAIFFIPHNIYFGTEPNANGGKQESGSTNKWTFLW